MINKLSCFLARVSPGVSPLLLILLAAVVLFAIAVAVAAVMLQKKRKLKCRHCGAPLKPGAIFCENCVQRV